jgi:hypothetical protein
MSNGRASTEGDSTEGDSNLTRRPTPDSGPNTRPRSIADHYSDLLSFLDTNRQRLGWIHRLVEGYYDGWRPSRGEVADLIAVDLGVLTIDEAAQRHVRRTTGHYVPTIQPRLERRVQHRQPASPP